MFKKKEEYSEAERERERKRGGKIEVGRLDGGREIE